MSYRRDLKISKGGDPIQCFFAVNNVAYEVTAWVSPEGEAEEKQILLDALEGFKLP